MAESADAEPSGSFDVVELAAATAEHLASPSCRNSRLIGAIYAGISEQAKAKIASKLTDAGFGT